jgi:hypothetical protein
MERWLVVDMSKVGYGVQEASHGVHGMARYGMVHGYFFTFFVFSFRKILPLIDGNAGQPPCMVAVVGLRTTTLCERRSSQRARAAENGYLHTMYIIEDANACLSNCGLVRHCRKGSQGPRACAAGHGHGGASGLVPNNTAILLLDTCCAVNHYVFL